LQIVLVATALSGGQVGADQSGGRGRGEATRRRPQIQKRWSEFTVLRLVLRLRGVDGLNRFDGSQFPRHEGIAAIESGNGYSEDDQDDRDYHEKFDERESLDCAHDALHRF
jgi:hypothetical protein